ncbi:MAG: hypothetical protein INR70_41035, partial [Parafilimonas terrae]|nr:hypothetical protein [Parafilimonas terrae]
MRERERAIARVVALQGKVKALRTARLAAAEATKAALVAERDALQDWIEGA